MKNVLLCALILVIVAGNLLLAGKLIQMIQYAKIKKAKRKEKNK